MEQLGVDEEDVKPEASFVDDLNADSLDLVELIMSLEEEFGTEISDEDAEKIRTVQDAVDYIDEHSTSSSSPARPIVWRRRRSSPSASGSSSATSRCWRRRWSTAATSTSSRRPAQSNERLEFLGDSVLSLVISEALWRASSRPTTKAR